MWNSIERKRPNARRMNVLHRANKCEILIERKGPMQGAWNASHRAINVKLNWKERPNARRMETSRIGPLMWKFYIEKEKPNATVLHRALWKMIESEKAQCKTYKNVPHRAMRIWTILYWKGKAQCNRSASGHMKCEKWLKRKRPNARRIGTSRTGPFGMKFY